MTMKLNAHGLVSETGQALADDLYEPLLEAHVAELETVINQVSAAVDEVHLNARKRLITGRGVGERLAELGQAGAKRIFALTTARRKPLDRDIARDEQQLAEIQVPEAPPSRPASVLARTTSESRAALIARREALYREIRDNLLKVTIGPDRDLRILESILGDPIDDARDVILALQQAPALVRRSLVTDRVFDNLKEQYLRRANPEALKTHSAAGAALGILIHNQQAAFKATTGSSNVPASLVEVAVA